MTPPLKAARERVEEAVSILERMGKTGFPAVDDLRLILAALAEQDWRPIETAPRDGTRFDVWCASPGWQGREFDCWFGTHPDSPWQGHLINICPMRGQTGIVTDAVFWRPLPAPPVEVKGP